jgi:hypothetical protein
MFTAQKGSSDCLGAGFKTFAFNYSPPTASHTNWETIALYQLRGDKWVALRSPVGKTSQRTQLAQLAQLAKERLPKSDPDHDILRVRNWTDANTTILYCSSFRVGSGSKLNVLFTLKFDAEGNSKIVKTHKMSDPEVDESNLVRNSTVIVTFGLLSLATVLVGVSVCRLELDNGALLHDAI